MHIHYGCQIKYYVNDKHYLYFKSYVFKNISYLHMFNLYVTVIIVSCFQQLVFSHVPRLIVFLINEGRSEPSNICFYFIC